MNGIQRIKDSNRDLIATMSSIGEVLRMLGLVDADRLAEAVVIHKATGMRLGEVVVGKGWATEEQIAEAMDFQAQLRGAGTWEAVMELRNRALDRLARLRQEMDWDFPPTSPGTPSAKR